MELTDCVLHHLHEPSPGENKEERGENRGKIEKKKLLLTHQQLCSASPSVYRCVCVYVCVCVCVCVCIVLYVGI